jgi:hypothetical protein
VDRSGALITIGGTCTAPRCFRRNPTIDVNAVASASRRPIWTDSDMAGGG